MLLTLNEPVVSDRQSYFVILVTLRGERSVKDDTAVSRWRKEPYDYHEFFQADRYSPYGGRLRTVPYASEAKRWQTAEGARKALDRLVERKTVQSRHRAVVVRYTEFLTRQYDVVPPPVEAPVEG